MLVMMNSQRSTHTEVRIKFKVEKGGLIPAREFRSTLY